jgi:hypothetical protein
MNQATPIADMITEMLKNCIPLDMIIVAVRSMERAVSTRHPVDETAEKRRAWDREYRRLKREQEREHPPDQPDIHPNTPDVGKIALSSLKEVKGHSEVVSKKESKKERARGFKIPPDWKPNERHYDEGQKLGMTRAMVDDRARAMRLWCEANANRDVTTKANWDSTFTGTWLRDSRNGHSNQQNRTAGFAGPTPTRDDAIIAGMGRALDRRREARIAADGGRQEFREERGDGGAGRTAAEPRATPGDGIPSRQLALIPRGND